MGVIKQQITDQLKTAMRARDTHALDALRFGLSQIKYKEIEVGHELDDAGIIAVLNAEVKKRREAIELFQKSGRTELAEEEIAKLGVLTALLPAQISDEELGKIVHEVVVQATDKSMGALMKAALGVVGDKADGRRVSQAVQQAVRTT